MTNIFSEKNQHQILVMDSNSILMSIMVGMERENVRKDKGKNRVKIQPFLATFERVALLLLNRYQAHNSLNLRRFLDAEPWRSRQKSPMEMEISCVRNGLLGVANFSETSIYLLYALCIGPHVELVHGTCRHPSTDGTACYIGVPLLSVAFWTTQFVYMDCFQLYFLDENQWVFPKIGLPQNGWWK